MRRFLLSLLLVLVYTTPARAVFPDPSIADLDTGRRADEAPISNGGKWSHWTTTLAPNQMQIVANHITENGAGSFNYWNVSPFTGKVQIQITVNSALPVGSAFALSLNMVNPNLDTYSGYFVYFSIGASNVIDASYWRTDSGTGTTLASSPSITTLTAGDAIGIEYDAGTMRIYQNGTVIGSFAIGVIYTSGYIGMGLSNTASGGVFNDFFGGAVSTGGGGGGRTKHGVIIK